MKSSSAAWMSPECSWAAIVAWVEAGNRSDPALKWWPTTSAYVPRSPTASCNARSVAGAERPPAALWGRTATNIGSAPLSRILERSAPAFTFPASSAFGST
jgi:hypothetical protein